MTSIAWARLMLFLSVVAAVTLWNIGQIGGLPGYTWAAAGTVTGGLLLYAGEMILLGEMREEAAYQNWMEDDDAESDD